MLTIIVHSFLAVVGLMTFGFILSLLLRRNTIVDMFWGLGFIAVAWLSLYAHRTYLPRQILTTIMVTLWGFRLSGYILYRNWGKGEDPRYEVLAQKWGDWFYLRSFLQIFMLQAVLCFVIASPILAINLSSTAGYFSYTDYLTVLLWMIGFAFEVIGDFQLNRFLSHPDNKGKILKTGLWRYTRHPNYFGEILMWTSLFLLALPVPFGSYTIISPLTITAIFLFFSLPMTEKLFEHNEAFQEYKKKTSAIIPFWSSS